ncbi:ISL3 family transposase [Legionella pneumophila]|uniref:ISL3 family transposase n=1 Tax=Legionella pneumophila TaxID=446 RepID=A0AAP3MCF4_LEGPN|nr:ISL3 family transposase [Legionella pneumophila]ADG25704.1 Transposase-like protein [Legionella pneumophila 2300/99 Alcoy]MCZ4719145.1 ISL3 family transposase [Legionella pneumophila]MDW8892474.1 ISL3 family transposase [Legionella pneumophila]MDW9175661.1 ISL3 family transposase [Legionella pneumophila]WBA06397.1 TnpA transposase [Legionella pneumophila]
MPRKNLILNLPGFSIVKVSGYQPLLLDVSYNRLARCGHCQSKKVRKKSSYLREVHHELIGHRRSILRFKAYKLYCHDCGRYGNQQFPGINKHQRATWRAQAAVFHEHSRGVSQKDLSERYKKGKATIERWYQRHYEEQNRELLNRPCPIVLGIDEHFFSKKEGFATTFCDLRKHKVFDVVRGRREKELKEYLQQLPGKERVKVICMDLSSTYRSLVKKYFPNAMIVADRFHVIRLIQHQCMMTCRELSSEIKNNRGILALLRTRPDNLSDEKKVKRDTFFTENPAIESIYQFQQQLHSLLMKRALTQHECRKVIPTFLDMLSELKQSGFKALASLGRTLCAWKDEVARMWRFSKSNGITEGFHRKMKLIQRRAYGFRNFENYRVRVRVLCG